MMARKTQFTPQDVVNAAFELVKAQGIDLLSARNVAQVLGSSTAPVYSNFHNMEELESSVFALAASKLLDYSTRPHTDNPFLNMGIGVLTYARDCPLWYFAFSTRRDPGQLHLRGVLDALLAAMASIPEVQGLPFLERKFLLRKLSVFTHGLALEICSGSVTDERMADYCRLLEDVGAALLADTLARSPRQDDNLARMATFCHEISIETENLDQSPRKDDGHE